MALYKVCMLSTSYICSKDDFSLHHDLAKRLVEKGIQVNVICPHDEKKSKDFEEVDGVKIFRFQYFFPRSLQRLAYRGGIPHNLKKSLFSKIQLPFFMISFFFRSLNCAKNSDIIHAQFIPSGLVGVFLKKLFKKQLIVQVHEGLLSNSFPIKKMNKFVLENADYAVFNSSYTMKNAKERFNLKEHSIIHPSIDERLFFPLSQTSVIRKKFSLPKDTKVIFCVGRLVEKKGFGYLIEAMNLLPKKYNAVCVIGGFGPEEEQLRKIAKELNLDKRVFFAGRIENADLPNWINDCDIFVVPSIIDSQGEIETFGIVAMEASSCGKPVIASNIGGLTDIVEDNITGLLAEQKNPKQIAEKIEFLLKNPKFAEELGKNARKKVERKLAWSIAIKQMLEVYLKVLKKY